MNYSKTVFALFVLVSSVAHADNPPSYQSFLHAGRPVEFPAKDAIELKVVHHQFKSLLGPPLSNMTVFTISYAIVKDSNGLKVVPKSATTHISVLSYGGYRVGNFNGIPMVEVRLEYGTSKLNTEIHELFGVEDSGKVQQIF